MGEPVMRGAELVTGQTGLDRSVTWCVLDKVIDFETWIMPGTLLVYTGMRDDYDFESELSFCFSYEVAGIIVIGAREFLTQENIDACARENLAIIKMPANTKLINFTRRISAVLSGDVSEEEREEDWLKDLCFTQGTRPNEVVARYYGWDDTCDYACATFETHDENLHIVQSENHLMIAKSVVLRNGTTRSARPLSFVTRGMLVAFLPFEKETSIGLKHKRIQRLLACIQKAVPDTQWVASMGSIANDLSQMVQSFYDAREVRAFAERVGRGDNPVYYDQWALEMLCMSASQQELKKQSDLLLQPIKDDPELMDTLAVYLEAGENGKETATRLYVHPSTLRYRVRKIEKILDMNLEDSWTRFRLRMAMNVDAYLNGRDDAPTLREAEEA